MKPSEIMRSTRQGMGLNQREFARLLAESTASGCSTGAVSHWEVGRLNINYERMHYVYTHAARPELREMAGRIMCELNPEHATRDVMAEQSCA